jgi:hypothetical protein
MTGAGVVDDQCGVVSQTSGGVSLKEAHPYAHPPRPPSHLASRCAPSPYQVPWPNVRRGLFLPRSPIGSLRWFFRQFTTLFHHVDFSVILRVRPDDDWQIGSVVVVRTTRVWSTLSPVGSISVSPSEPSLCPSCASFTRPSRTGAGGRWLVPDPVTSLDSDSCRLISPNLSVKNSREPRNHLELGRNFVVDWNAIVFTMLDHMSPTVGANCRGFMTRIWE